MAVKPSPEATATVVSVDRALALLELLATRPEGIGTREASRKLGIGAGSAQKVLNTLRVRNFIEKAHSADRYVFGPAAYRLAHLIRASADVDLTSAARPYLQDLAEATGETVFLGLRDGDDCRYVDKITSRQMTRVDLPLGQPRPLNCTAVGKVMLAFDETSLAELRRFVSRNVFARATDFSITDPMELAEELERVRTAGWAADRREYDPSAACVAAPIVGLHEEVLGALSVSGPAERIEPHIQEIAATLLRVTTRLNLSLRGRPHAPADSPIRRRIENVHTEPR